MTPQDGSSTPPPRDDPNAETPNPFLTSDSADSQPGGAPHKDPSIEFEPHLQGQFCPPDESELKAELALYADPEDPSGADAIEHTVWDEPALSAPLAGEAPEGQLTYARWIEEKLKETTTDQTWRTTLLLVLAAGPWGVLGALITQMSAGGLSFSGFLAAAILAPVTEEITKIAAALWVVEKRPYLFSSPLQILVCAFAGGLAFATIENLIYLFVYNPGGGASYAAWRWIICTALHVVCSTVAGVGLVRIWKDALANRRHPELALGMPMFAAAMIGHGLYNTAVTFAEASGLLSF